MVIWLFVYAFLSVDVLTGRDTFKNKIQSAAVVPHATSNNNAFRGYVYPQLLNEVYSIHSNAGSSLASQAVVEIQDQSLSTSDLDKFQHEFNLPLDSIDHTVGGHVITSCDGGTCQEANLDVQYLMAVSQNTPTTYMYWNGTDFWVDWITSVANMEDPPLVISISYAEYEHDIAQSYADAFNFEAMKLSLAGVTLVAGSGDDGVSGPDARDDALRCGFFPQFPATSPYVTSIGATMVSCFF